MKILIPMLLIVIGLFISVPFIHAQNIRPRKAEEKKLHRVLIQPKDSTRVPTNKSSSHSTPQHDSVLQPQQPLEFGWRPLTDVFVSYGSTISLSGDEHHYSWDLRADLQTLSFTSERFTRFRFEGSYNSMVNESENNTAHTHTVLGINTSFMNVFGKRSESDVVSVSGFGLLAEGMYASTTSGGVLIKDTLLGAFGYGYTSCPTMKTPQNGSVESFVRCEQSPVILFFGVFGSLLDINLGKSSTDEYGKDSTETIHTWGPYLQLSTRDYKSGLGIDASVIGLPFGRNDNATTEYAKFVIVPSWQFSGNAHPRLSGMLTYLTSSHKHEHAASSFIYNLMFSLHFGN